MSELWEVPSVARVCLCTLISEGKIALAAVSREEKELQGPHERQKNKEISRKNKKKHKSVFYFSLSFSLTCMPIFLLQLYS